MLVLNKGRVNKNKNMTQENERIIEALIEELEEQGKLKSFYEKHDTSKMSDIEAIEKMKEHLN